MRGTIPAIVFAASLSMLLNASCGGADTSENQIQDQGSGVIGVVEAINEIATPPVPTGVIHDARDAADAANAHAEAVDSILGSQ